MTTEDQLDFAKVQEAELEEIAKSRAQRCNSGGTLAVRDLVGLAFSGGGIRSATFNLGIVQALASRDLLRHVDYLSTVSGGGYIGSWLTAWIRRAGIHSVSAELARPNPGPEAAAVTYLRQHSNYLTPRTGLLGADTWTAISTYLRNLVLNLLILLPALVAILMLPRLLMVLFLFGSDSAGWVHLLPGLCCLAVAGGFTGWNLWMVADDEALLKVSPRWAVGKVVHGGILIPSLLAAYCGSCWLWSAGDNEYKALSRLAGSGPDWWRWGFVVALVHVLVWSPAVVQGLRSKAYTSKDKLRAAVGILLSAWISGVVGGVLLWLAAQQIWAWREVAPWEGAGAWAALAFGPPLLLAVFTLTLVLHIGLMSRNFSEYQREWWSRLGGWILIYSGSWLLVFLSSMWAPWYFAQSSKLASSVSLAGIVTTAAGLWSAASAQTTGTSSQLKGGSNKILENLAAFAPYLFCIGVLVLLALGLEIGLGWAGDWGSGGFDASAPTRGRVLALLGLISKHHWGIAWSTFNPLLCFTVFLFSIVIVALLSWRVDVNQFSMHHLYRNRLIRAYLGASAIDRRPHPFTGFSAHDDVLLADLTTSEGYFGPYPLINTALNLVKGEELAWQNRKAASFVLAPLRSGWGSTGYRLTGAMAGEHLSLGTALAISGAAASPNMGYHSSAPLAFLMTIFNVRLGWWLGNPRRGKWRNPGPRMGLMYLLAELFGYTDAKASYVYLSDGGHFENLGIYELVRRRCRMVVICDASQDEKYVFSDLGSAIRKCRTDLGVEIDVDIRPLLPDPASRRSVASHVIGTIRYPDSELGALVYVKPALLGDETPDVQNYAKEQDQFPHQSTGDQWFDESQFESYRALGRLAGERLVTEITEAMRNPVDGVGRLLRLNHPLG